jgi:hypothetical protein
MFWRLEKRYYLRERSVQAGKGRSVQAEKRKEMQCNSQLIPTTTKVIN